MSNNTIGKRIRFYREAKKWSQEVFAEKLGLSLTYVGMLERGEKLPKLETDSPYLKPNKSIAQKPGR